MNLFLGLPKSPCCRVMGAATEWIYLLAFLFSSRILWLLLALAVTKQETKTQDISSAISWPRVKSLSSIFGKPNFPVVMLLEVAADVPSLSQQLTSLCSGCAPSLGGCGCSLWVAHRDEVIFCSCAICTDISARNKDQQIAKNQKTRNERGKISSKC